MRRRLVPAALAASILIIVLAVGAFFWARGMLQDSLPQLDGRRQLAGLTAPVTVTRDALGVPTVRGLSRSDVALATGFLHGQDRFFQMDLARRRAAGELSALVGARALALDREIRVHRFRAQAKRAVSLLTPRERVILDAYVAGVNAGLAALAAVPFEYRLLRQAPERWLAEDSLLVVLSMFVVLQDTDGSYEAALATMHDVLPAPAAAFLAPRGTAWDSPVLGAAFTMPPIPDAATYDLRARRRGKPSYPVPPRPQRGPLRGELGTTDAEAALGSNNWAVAGSLTGDGGALIANDVHLQVRVPNTWYRAAVEWPEAARSGEVQRLAGVMLPGMPSFVVGSNTHVAWGFTNTYADWSDIVLLDIDPANPRRYRAPDGWREIERHDEVIAVAGEPDQHAVVDWTMWGPVLGPDHRGRARAYNWVAHSAEALAASILPLESATTIEEAFDSANGVGAPGQNLVAADRTGRVGWTVFGALPRRRGFDGRLPTSWADGTRGWFGWLDPAEYPRILNPASGRIWTANARVVDGDMLAKLGDGSYEVGSRARSIRDHLMARDRFTARDMLAIQLDARGTFLTRWRELLLRTLTQSRIAQSPGRARFRDVVERNWTGEATPESAAYRLTRMFREQVSERVMAFLLVECYEADHSFDHTTIRNREGPIWTLITERPEHLLDPQYRTWEDLLVDAVDTVLAQLERDGNGDLSERRWSEYNVTTYRHPLSPSLPFIGRLLDMPMQPLPGDLFTIRVHWGSLASALRMVVSPGREAEGIMHMPTGQSGHPLSPFYANSHQAWVRGDPTPFLPGPTQHTLQLVPQHDAGD